MIMALDGEIALVGGMGSDWSLGSGAPYHIASQLILFFIALPMRLTMCSNVCGLAEKLKVPGYYYANR
jgi:hypothetical protein